MKLPTFKIKQGIIHIDHIDVMHCSEDVLVFSVETKQKRTIYKGEAGTPSIGSFGFYLGADEETLYVDYPHAPNTEILIEGWSEKGDFWMFVEAGKYYLRFAITKVERVAQFIDDDNFTDGTL